MIIRVVLSMVILIASFNLVKAEEAYSAVEKLLQTSTTVLGQPLHYPATGTPEITAVIVTMKPGEKTSRHLHEAPLFGYVLEGELTVYYDGHGSKTYKTGDALMEAVEIWHQGTNSGTTTMRILAVFMGAKGTKDTIVKE